MRKLRYGILFLGLILTLAACSKEEDTPVDRLSAYVDLWNDAKFTEMYDDYITESSKDVFGKEQFIERAEKLYADLGISSIEVIFDKPEEEKTYKKEEDVEFPVQIKLETIAGEIDFKKNVPLTYKEQGETKNWFIEWDPSFILPDLSMHDKVRISTIQSKRGEIYDRHNKALAINGSGVEIGIVPEKFNTETDAEKLATLLGTTANFINEQLNQSWVQPDLFVPIKKLSFTQEDIYNEALQIAGVTSMKAEMREYPYAESLAHLIGYIGQINAEELEKLNDKGYKESDLVGKRGLEQLLEERLRGEDGIKIYIEKTEQNAEKIMIAETPAIDGENITLTIDAEFQKAVFAEMNGEPGTAAIVDPKTGETLVLASSPAFDPNELSLGISSTRYAELTDDPAEPLLNRFAATYAPGSSIKPITAAIGLSTGTLKPDEGHTIEGKKWRKDGSWGNFQVTRVYTAPNPVDLKKALVYSDNIYFAKEALEMGSEQFVEGLQQFGFGEEIPFKYGLRTSQISNDGKITSEGQLADTSFGQGQMLMNILHLASTYGAIVNEGQMTKPVLFADEKKSEVWKEELLSAEHAAILQEDLRAVVSDGFAEAANISSPKISGKTGTTELKSSLEEAGKENGFFVAYPTDDPTYIIAMMIEGVENKGGSGYVAEKVANVMKTR
ncbi:penicillin-binding transpeptidase domain-containing protein [Sporosarcina pasteurii]|uniref:Penicillin-binding protein 2 n=1 Tax=Sporosarcina pasteurii TaxID=1474 RepID=A0A380C7Z4_SPOPA|nr:penicillin-binding transpeptidase domain-containing protein [Sporosarcina pasteurii]MDS9473043.1 penicillin-binding transpeptidase domain-containing protein [Sporosarcina pasteurii]QBQ04552.1 penicillin-binding transpeptidase domain-containing protein [Sporosarcina pasteurii]SUJ14182.1 Penicillin-binding protein 2 [Sporosarcina pasteurii]